MDQERVTVDPSVANGNDGVDSEPESEPEEGEDVSNSPLLRETSNGSVEIQAGVSPGDKSEEEEEEEEEEKFEEKSEEKSEEEEKEEEEAPTVVAAPKPKRQKREQTVIIEELRAKLAETNRKHSESTKKLKAQFAAKIEKDKEKLAKVRGEAEDASGKAKGKHKLERKLEKRDAETEELKATLHSVKLERDRLSCMRNDLRRVLEPALKRIDHEVPDCDLVAMVAKRLKRLSTLATENQKLAQKVKDYHKRDLENLISGNDPKANLVEAVSNRVDSISSGGSLIEKSVFLEALSYHLDFLGKGEPA